MCSNSPEEKRGMRTTQPEEKDWWAWCFLSKSCKNLFSKLCVCKRLVANRNAIICFLSLWGMEQNPKLALQEEVSVWTVQQCHLQSPEKLSPQTYLCADGLSPAEPWVWVTASYGMQVLIKFTHQNDWASGESRQQWAPGWLCLTLKSGKTPWIPVRRCSVGYSIWALASVSYLLLFSCCLNCSKKVCLHGSENGNISYSFPSVAEK